MNDYQQRFTNAKETYTLLDISLPTESIMATRHIQGLHIQEYIAAFKVSSYKVKDCTKLYYYCKEKGNYYLYLEILSENVVKAAGVSGAKVQKLPYPLDGPI